MLGTLTPQAFLSQFWQQKALQIPDAFPEFISPIQKQDLFTLATRDDVESRLVMAARGDRSWVLHHGPFGADDLSGLPQRDWTLLVQDVDKFLPAVAALLTQFDFIPGWRIEDIMVSFAPTGGSVGPHLDNYDVFLLQASGHRHWQIASPGDYSSADFMPDTELKILNEFHCSEQWSLGPGDLLYLPPGVPHHGVAEDDCITLSIGFRAPDVAEMVAACIEQVTARIDDLPRYADPAIEPVAQAGEIGADAVARAERLLDEALADWKSDNGGWFGSLVTEPKPGLETDPAADPLSRHAIVDACRHTSSLRRDPRTRMAWIVDAPDTLRLFVNGVEYQTSDRIKPLVTRLCADPVVDAGDLAAWLDIDPALELLQILINEGAFFLDD